MKQKVEYRTVTDLVGSRVRCTFKGDAIQLDGKLSVLEGPGRKTFELLDPQPSRPKPVIFRSSDLISLRPL